VGEHLETLTAWLSTYGYPVLFGVVLAENAGLPVPGETAVLVAALLASQPGSPLSIGWVIVLTILAAVLGDNLGFWLGRRWARGRLEQGKRFLFLTPKTLKSVEGYFEHYGTLTIFFARFVTGLRVVAAVAAGTSRMPWPRFLVANTAGAVAWATAMASLGYFCGHSWQALHRWLGRGGLIILGCVVVLVGLPYLWRRLRKVPAASWNRLLRAQLWQGIVAAILVVVCVAGLVLLAERHSTPPSEDRQVRRWVAEQHVPLAERRGHRRQLPGEPSRHRGDDGSRGDRVVASGPPEGGGGGPVGAGRQRRGGLDPARPAPARRDRADPGPGLALRLCRPGAAARGGGPGDDGPPPRT